MFKKSRSLSNNISTVMDPRSLPLVTVFYPVQTLLKGLFIFMSLFGLPYTLLTAFLASLIGILRVLKTPQFSKEYLSRVFMNNHGQNLMYITFGSMGYVNYLYYAPVALFFAYGIAEYVNLKMPQSSLARYANLARNNRAVIMEGKAKLEIIFFLYVLITLPLDLMGRLVKVFLMGQFLLIKYKISPQFRSSCTSINLWVDSKTSSFSGINAGYRKLINWIYQFATRDMQSNQ